MRKQRLRVFHWPTAQLLHEVEFVEMTGQFLFPISSSSFFMELQESIAHYEIGADGKLVLLGQMTIGHPGFRCRLDSRAPNRLLVFTGADILTWTAGSQPPPVGKRSHDSFSLHPRLPRPFVVGDRLIDAKRPGGDVELVCAREDAIPNVLAVDFRFVVRCDNGGYFNSTSRLIVQDYAASDPPSEREASDPNRVRICDERESGQGLVPVDEGFETRS